MCVCVCVCVGRGALGSQSVNKHLRHFLFLFSHAGSVFSVHIEIACNHSILPGLCIVGLAQVVVHVA